MGKHFFVGLATLLSLTTIIEIANADNITVNSIDEGYFAVNPDGTSTGPYYNYNVDGIFIGKTGPNSNYSPVATTGINEYELTTLSSSTINFANFIFQIKDPMDAGISSCFDMNGCPGITGLDIYGYAGNGTVEQSDTGAGSLITEIEELPSFGSYITIDVTSFIRELVNSNDPYAGFSIRAAGATGGGLWLSDGSLSIDYTDISTTNPVPEPATMLLFGTGLAGLAGLRKRSKK